MHEFEGQCRSPLGITPEGVLLGANLPGQYRFGDHCIDFGTCDDRIADAAFAAEVASVRASQGPSTPLGTALAAYAATRRSSILVRATDCSGHRAYGRAVVLDELDTERKHLPDLASIAVADSVVDELVALSLIGAVVAGFGLLNLPLWRRSWVSHVTWTTSPEMLQRARDGFGLPWTALPMVTGDPTTLAVPGWGPDCPIAVVMAFADYVDRCRKGATAHLAATAELLDLQLPGWSEPISPPPRATGPVRLR